MPKPITYDTPKTPPKGADTVVNSVDGINKKFAFYFKCNSPDEVRVSIEWEGEVYYLVQGDGVVGGTYTLALHADQRLKTGGFVTLWWAPTTSVTIWPILLTETPREVVICNMALARLGDEAAVTSISPPDGSPQARYCAMFYEAAVSSVLDEHQWSFATKTTALDRAQNDDSRWLYSYVLPTDFNRVISVFGPYSGRQAFSLATNDQARLRLYSNQAHAQLEYAVDVADATLFPPSFVDALAWKLAANLAGVIIKGDTGAAAELKLQQAYQGALKLAKEADCQNRSVSPLSRLPEGIAARA